LSFLESLALLTLESLHAHEQVLVLALLILVSLMIALPGSIVGLVSADVERDEQGRALVSPAKRHAGFLELALLCR